ncbi:hypothetical protein HDU84_004499 [Entophlyctis sp. JEL0112]|nr:hypothetical protein HDU84_004499 [Entophlyctis sp. JEL0112]
MHSHSLRNRSVQLPFFADISRRFNTDVAAGKNLDPVLAALRKLREGIVSAGIMDDFAVRVYEFSVSVCLRAQNYPELLKSLTYLVGVLYPAFQRDTGSDEKLADVKGQHAKMTGLLMLYLTCYLPMSAKNSTIRSSKVVSESKEVLKLYKSAPISVQTSNSVIRAMDIHRAILRDVDFVHFKKLWNQLDPDEQIIVKQIIPHVRERTLDILTKSYFTLPFSFISKYTIFSEDVQVLEDIFKQKFSTEFNLRVVDGTVHLRLTKRK